MALYENHDHLTKQTDLVHEKLLEERIKRLENELAQVRRDLADLRRQQDFVAPYPGRPRPWYEDPYDVWPPPRRYPPYLTNVNW